MNRISEEHIFTSQNPLIRETYVSREIAEEMLDTLIEINEYLHHNKLNTIASGSTIHKKVDNIIESITEKTIHFKVRDNIAACGLISPNTFLAYDARDCNCEDCKKTERYKIYMGIK